MGGTHEAERAQGRAQYAHARTAAVQGAVHGGVVVAAAGVRRPLVRLVEPAGDA
jgi:hypothetical protein